MTTETVRTQTLRHTAKNWEKETFKQIDDFGSISVDIDIKIRRTIDHKGEEHIYYETNHYNKETERTDIVVIPEAVIFKLHKLLKERPNMKYFKAFKDGIGTNWVWKVIEVECPCISKKQISL